MNSHTLRSSKTRLSCLIISSLVTVAAWQSPAIAQPHPSDSPAAPAEQPTQLAPQSEAPETDGSGSSMSTIFDGRGPGEIAAIATTGVVVVGFIGTAVGWAISEGLIPNPLPGVIHIGQSPNRSQPGQQKLPEQPPRFNNCDEVEKAFGRKGPYLKGDPAYQDNLDQNKGGKNGIACE